MLANELFAMARARTVVIVLHVRTALSDFI